MAPKRRKCALFLCARFISWLICTLSLVVHLHVLSGGSCARHALFGGSVNAKVVFGSDLLRAQPCCLNTYQ